MTYFLLFYIYLFQNEDNPFVFENNEHKTFVKTEYNYNPLYDYKTSKKKEKYYDYDGNIIINIPFKYGTFLFFKEIKSESFELKDKEKNNFVNLNNYSGGEGYGYYYFNDFFTTGFGVIQYYNKDNGYFADGSFKYNLFKLNLLYKKYNSFTQSVFKFNKDILYSYSNGFNENIYLKLSLNDEMFDINLLIGLKTEERKGNYNNFYLSEIINNDIFILNFKTNFDLWILFNQIEYNSFNVKINGSFYDIPYFLFKNLNDENYIFKEFFLLKHKNILNTGIIIKYDFINISQSGGYLDSLPFENNLNNIINGKLRYKFDGFIDITRLGITTEYNLLNIFNINIDFLFGELKIDGNNNSVTSIPFTSDKDESNSSIKQKCKLFDFKFSVITEIELFKCIISYNQIIPFKDLTSSGNSTNRIKGGSFFNFELNYNY